MLLLLLLPPLVAAWQIHHCWLSKRTMLWWWCALWADAAPDCCTAMTLTCDPQSLHTLANHAPYSHQTPPPTPFLYPCNSAPTASAVRRILLKSYSPRRGFVLSFTSLLLISLYLHSRALSLSFSLDHARFLSLSLFSKNEWKKAELAHDDAMITGEVCAFVVSWVRRRGWSRVLSGEPVSWRAAWRRDKCRNRRGGSPVLGRPKFNKPIFTHFEGFAVRNSAQMQKIKMCRVIYPCWIFLFWGKNHQIL
jgi:hypothetical protein